MLAKTITYTDFNDNERTETFYFNLTKAEITKLELSVNGGYSELLKRVSESNDAPLIRDTFEKFIIDSYGEKSPDGREFYKSEEITKRFMATEAYSVLFMELCSDAKAAADFIKAVIPKKVAEELSNGVDDTSNLTAKASANTSGN